MKESDERFIATMIKKHGSVEAALVEVRRLRKMSHEGREWWSFIEARLAYLKAGGLQK